MHRILIIDNDRQTRVMTRDILGKLGNQVYEAGDRNQGLKLCGQVPMDLIISGKEVPDNDGLETINDFRRRYPRTKIVALSGENHPESGQYLERAKARGADFIFTKPGRYESALRLLGAFCCPEVSN